MVGVYFVPAFNGLAAPHWDPNIKATILGLSTSTNIGHLIRAATEGIAYQIRDLLHLMKSEVDTSQQSLRCSGGMSENHFLMQMISDLLQVKLLRSNSKEITCLGAAYMAGLSCGFFKSKEQIASHWQEESHFSPLLAEEEVNKMIYNWNRAIEATKLWSNNEKKK